MRRAFAAILVVASLAGCLSPSPPSDGALGEDETEWPDRSVEFAANGGPGTGFLIFLELADPRDGEHEWSSETTMASMNVDGATVWRWDFGLVASSHTDSSLTPQPGRLERWEAAEWASTVHRGTYSASFGGADVLGLVYGFASPAAWEIDLKVEYEGSGFAALHHWPITGFDVHEEAFGGSVGHSTGTATFDLEGAGWTLALLHRIETYPQRGYQTSITFPSGYTCSDTWVQSSVRVPPGEIETSDWFAHFADGPGTFTFEASDVGLDALESLQVARLRFDEGLPDSLPFPDHAEGFVSLL
ncbi:MAG TPA: hypothetical protein VHG52_08585, partial [Thermomicrobiales bacterium]|nr:hypothetical protein [Thermomicrobiales bacterium]